MVKAVSTLVTAMLLSSLCISGVIAAPAEFVASESCELYQSRRKMTNPQSLRTEVGASYRVEDQAVDADGTAWVYVAVTQPKLQKRWLKASCGAEGASGQALDNNDAAEEKASGFSLSGLAGALFGGAKSEAQASAKAQSENQSKTPLKASGTSTVKATVGVQASGSAMSTPKVAAVAYGPVRGVAGSCSTAGAFDGNVLALSWQATYCETRGHYKECKLAKRGSAAKEFSLHGLWPNKRSCGANYGYCGAVKSKPAGNFCDYPSFTVDKALVPTMAKAMPSMAAGGCLHRHEWWKHGTCAGSNATVFYTLATNFLDEVNSSDFVREFVSKNIGRKVQRSTFTGEFEKSFGRGSAKKVSLHCDGDKLKEIRLSLPASLTSASSLKTQLAKAANARRSDCRASFEIDAF